MYEFGDSARRGALLSYGPSLAELAPRAAEYVDRILKGAKPGDLPLEGPTRYYLTVNLKTAKALGIEVPTSILLRAGRFHGHRSLLLKIQLGERGSKLRIRPGVALV